MALQFIGIDPDSGTGQCPTVRVDEDTADVVIQGWKADGALLARCLETGWIPDSEGVVRIPARMVATLGRHAMPRSDAVPGFDVLLDGARHSAFHLEMRDAYGVAEESSGLADRPATGRRNADPDSEYWAFQAGLVRRTVARGVSVRRARIVSEPLSDYARYSHAGAVVNIAAGEGVRYLPRRHASTIALPGNDFWLIDGRLVLEPLHRQRHLRRRGDDRQPGRRRTVRLRVRSRLGARRPLRRLQVLTEAMTSPLPSAQAARGALATRLRRLRLDASLAGHQLSLACGWHPAKTSWIENTHAFPSDADIRAWCAACGADGRAEDLIAAARSATSMYVEWKRLNRAGPAGLQQEIVPLVQRTRAFRGYCSHVVPGLLQTSAYAAAVIAAYGTFHGVADDARAAAAARVERSGVLHKRGRRFAFLIEESVLHSRIADPDTTAAQLEHLIELAGLPQVSLGIIATRATRPLWSMESFTVYDDAQVGIELLSARVTVTTPGEVATYERAFADLAAHAAGARTLIRRAAAAHG